MMFDPNSDDLLVRLRGYLEGKIHKVGSYYATLGLLWCVKC